MTSTEDTQLVLLRRIADALDRLAPTPLPAADLARADCFVFQPPTTLQPVDIPEE